MVKMDDLMLLFKYGTRIAKKCYLFCKDKSIHEKLPISFYIKKGCGVLFNLHQNQ